MITDFEVTRALDRLRSVFPPPKNPAGAFEEWRKALRTESLNVMPAELEYAVDEFIATTEISYGFPAPAQIVTLIKASRAATTWTEPEPEDPPADPSFIRKAWEAEGIDLEELRRAHRAMKVRRGETA